VAETLVRFEFHGEGAGIRLLTERTGATTRRHVVSIGGDMRSRGPGTAPNTVT
jgi:hypothetical protein